MIINGVSVGCLLMILVISIILINLISYYEKFKKLLNIIFMIQNNLNCIIIRINIYLKKDTHKICINLCKVKLGLIQKKDLNLQK
jgi:hypothetical protein